MNIALFNKLQYDFETTGEESLEGGANYVRLSEYVEVDFPTLDIGDIINGQVEVIDAQIKTEQVAAEIKLNELKQRRDELLALPNLSQEQ